MQRNQIYILTVLLTMSVLATGAQAQDRSYSASGMQNSQMVRASDLIGTDVRDPQGDKVGKVDELLLDSQGTSVSHVVVARGGFLGLGVKRHAVSWREMKLSGATATGGTMNNDNDRAVMINTLKDQFAQSSPALDSNAWKEYNADDNMSRSSRRVTDILGSDIHGGADKSMGEVEDLVIDADRGQVAYALVEYDGDWKLDEKFLSVPWPSLNRRGDTISMNLDESSARQLAYRDEDFNRLGDQDQRTRRYGATQSQGYWNEGTSGSLGANDRNSMDSSDRYGTAGRRTDDQASDESPGKRPAHGATSDMKGEQVTITGTVESVMNQDSLGTYGRSNSPGARARGHTDMMSTTGAPAESGDGLTFRVKTASGSTVTVDAGPKADLDRQNLTLNNGDRVTVTGHKMGTGTSSGTGSAGLDSDKVMATSIQKGSQTIRIERGAMGNKKHQAPGHDQPRNETRNPRG